MAIKKKEETKRSKLWQMIVTEHKWENYVFVLVSLLVLVLGLLIVTNVLAVKADFPLIGVRPLFFAWTIIIVSSLGLIYALYPFFKPAWPELKRVTWPTWRLFFGNAIRVFIFLIVLSLLFLAYDIIITEALGKLLG